MFDPLPDTMRALPLLLALLLAGCSFPGLVPPPTPTPSPEPRPAVAVRQLLEGLESAVHEPARRAIGSQAEWETTWLQHEPARRAMADGQTRDLKRDAPYVEFPSERVIAAFAGDLGEACARIEVASAARAADGKTVVTIATTPMTPPCAGHSPFAFAAIPSDGSPLELLETHGAGEQRAPLDVPPCGELSMTLDRAQMRPHETVNVSARFAPCEGEAPLVTPSCVGGPLTAMVEGAYLLNSSGDATYGWFCDQPLAGIPTPEPVEQRWIWNGTRPRVAPCFAVGPTRQPCGGSEAFEPGARDVTVTARVGPWTFSASREIALLPERRELPVLRIDETLRGAETPADCSEGVEGDDGVLRMGSGASLVVERNLTTANGTRLLRYAIRDFGAITLTTADGAPLYRIAWLGDGARLDGEPLPAQQRAAWTSNGREVVDTREARMVAPRVVESDAGALTCVFAPA